MVASGCRDLNALSAASFVRALESGNCASEVRILLEAFARG
jgi:hypothetical protein